MKITKSQLKQIIKEELGSFFSAEKEEEEAATATSKAEFRKFRDITMEQVASLRSLQADKERLEILFRSIPEKGSQWQRMLAKIIQGLEENLKIATGPKGTHSGAPPLSEAGSYLKPYKQFLEDAREWRGGIDAISVATAVTNMLDHQYQMLVPYRNKYVSKNFLKYLKMFFETTYELIETLRRGN